MNSSNKGEKNLLRKESYELKPERSVIFPKPGLIHVFVSSFIH